MVHETKPNGMRMRYRTFTWLACTLVLAAATPARAEVVEYIWHVFSRACLFGPDETVSYNVALVTRSIATVSDQYIVQGPRMFLFKVVVDDYRDTARSYAGSCCHPYPTAVHGTHWSDYPHGHRYVMYESSAIDCNIGEF